MDRWKTRRRMAWISLTAGVCFPLLLLVANSADLWGVASPFYIFVGAVVGAYIGFSTVDDKWASDARYKDQRYSGGVRSGRFRRRGVDGERMATRRPVRSYEGGVRGSSYSGE